MMPTVLRFTQSGAAADPVLEISAAMKLPVELVQQVYQHLLPVDFNSARHTCRV